MTKDQLQQRRFQAQTLGTTYVYDFPEMFHQALLVLWKEYLQAKKKFDPSFVVDVDSMPGDLLHSIELVLDKNNHLTEMNRLQGENNIGKNCRPTGFLGLFSCYATASDVVRWCIPRYPILFL